MFPFKNEYRFLSFKRKFYILCLRYIAWMLHCICSLIYKMFRMNKQNTWYGTSNERWGNICSCVKSDVWALTKFLADGKTNFEGLRIIQLDMPYTYYQYKANGSEHYILSLTLLTNNHLWNVRMLGKIHWQKCSWEWITHSVLWHALST